MTGFEMTRFEVFKAHKYEILLAPYQSFSLKLESRHLVISSSRHLVISSSRHLESQLLTTNTFYLPKSHNNATQTLSTSKTRHLQ